MIDFKKIDFTNPGYLQIEVARDFAATDLSGTATPLSMKYGWGDNRPSSPNSFPQKLHPPGFGPVFLPMRDEAEMAAAFLRCWMSRMIYPCRRNLRVGNSHHEG
jgi:hypothetical protein